MNRVRAFIRAREGVSAVEFALIAPLLILLFVGSFEITRAVNMNRQVALLSRTVSDLISQTDSVSTSDLDNIFNTAGAVMYPYAITSQNPVIAVESIVVTSDGKAETRWSYPEKNTKVRESSYDGAADTSVIKAEVRYRPTFIFTFIVERLGLSDFTMSETSYMAPRLGSPVTIK